MGRPDECEAVYSGGDQKRCERCNLTWDNNSINEPDCKTDEEIINSQTTKEENQNEKILKQSHSEQSEITRQNIAKIKESLKN